MDAGIASGLFSAAALALVAIGLLAARFEDRAVRLFALLLALRSLAGLTYNAGLLATDPATAAFWWRTTPYFTLAVPFVAIAFAAAYPRRLRSGGLLVVAALAGALVAEAAYLVDHGLFWDLAGAPDGRGPQVGAGAGPLFVATALVETAFGLVAFACWRHAAAWPEGPRRSGAILVGLGFALVTVYDAVGLVVLAPEYAFRHGGALTVAMVACLATAVGLVAAAALSLARAAPRAVASLAVPIVSVAFAAGVTPVVPAFAPVDAVLAGLWRLALPILVAYGLLRHRLFDIDLRLKLTLRRGTVAAAFFAVFLIVSQVAENFLDARFGYVTGGVAAGVLLLALAPLQRAAERVAEAAFPGVSDRPDYVAYRKLVVYRAAVEGVWADLRVDPGETATLSRLREELGIAREDAAAVEAEVERAVRGRVAAG